jgi:dienelactone hydrolase/uncharacterized protein (DUF2141 family)
MSRAILGLALAGLLGATGAFAQPAGGTVTVALEKVRSDKGDVVVGLCADPKQPFPGFCTPQAKAPAKAGTTVVTFTGVAPGTYALQAFHDENGDGRPNIPPEGFAYGNGAGYPPNWKAAAITVAGDTATTVRMTYIGAQFGGRRQGGSGAAAPEGVIRTDVREGGLYGELYVAAGARKAPALVLIGGSEGGIDGVSRLAADFSKHGYAALALAYWAEPGLPKTLEGVPLEYFDQATAWLKARPEVDPKAIGAIGISRGSEAVLLLASRNSDIRAVGAFAPSSIVWQGLNFENPMAMKAAWTLGGKDVPFAMPVGSAYQPNGPLKQMFSLALGEADKRPETAIPVEKIKGPILLISGKDDGLWPSEDFAQRIEARLKAKRFAHPVVHLSYEGAGHAVFAGDPASPGLVARAKAPANAYLGGDGPSDARAWADDWPRTLAFFDKYLKPRGR